MVAVASCLGSTHICVCAQGISKVPDVNLTLTLVAASPVAMEVSFLCVDNIVVVKVSFLCEDNSVAMEVSFLCVCVWITLWQWK